MKWRIRKVGKEYWAERGYNIVADGEGEPLWDWSKACVSRDQNEVADYIEAMINPVIIREYP